MEWYIFNSVNDSTQIFIGVLLILSFSSLLWINLIFWVLEKWPVFHWEPGRQGGSYTKLKLWSRAGSRWGTDGWLIKYQPHYQMPTHTDPVEGQHWRLNIVVRGQGKFQCEQTIFQFGHRLVLFRPDLYPHSMINGPKIRTVLSIGWVRFTSKSKNYDA